MYHLKECDTFLHNYLVFKFLVFFQYYYLMKYEFYQIIQTVLSYLNIFINSLLKIFKILRFNLFEYFFAGIIANFHKYFVFDIIF